MQSAHRLESGLAPGWFVACVRSAAALLLVGLARISPAAAVDVQLVPFAIGLNDPVDIASAGDSRLFVVEQEGIIRIVRPDGSVDGTEFMDISGRVACCGEQGLLGLVFDPNYSSNGFFYVT